jgi:hypothetical protein
MRTVSVNTEEGTYVTDITHFLDDQGEVSVDMPREARQLASFLVLVIDATSRNIASDNQDINIRCRKADCTGQIRASLASTNDVIEWFCPDCGHNGVIRNWQATKWNQRTDGIG